MILPLFQYLISNILINGSVEGTQLFYYNGRDWVHVENLFATDGELHWFTENQTLPADASRIPNGGTVTYALPDGVEGIIFSGEVSFEESEDIEIQFVDEKTLENIRKELEKIASYRTIIREEVITNNITVAVAKENTRDKILTHEVVYTNFVTIAKNRFVVSTKNGKKIKAVFSEKLCCACDPESGFPIRCSIEDVVFVVDEAVDETVWANELMCSVFYKLQRCGGVGLNNDQKDDRPIKDSFFAYWLDAIWGVLFLVLSKILCKIKWVRLKIQKIKAWLAD